MTSNETLNVIHARAAGLDVHKMQITATVLIALPGSQPRSTTRTFSALPSGVRALVGWLVEEEVTAAVLEATGIYWEAPYEALEEAGMEPILVQAQHVKQIKGRKTDVADSVWLARICQFGLGSPSMIPPPLFRRLRKVSRLRRQLIRDRASLRNRIHKILDATGPRIGGVLSDAFGVNGMRILEGIVAGKPTEEILNSLSPHVRHRLKDLRDALAVQLDGTSRFLIRDLLDAYNQATKRLARYDARLDEELSDFREQIDLLMTIPGIDHYSACAIIIEIGPDILIFPSRRHCAAWAGLCPGNNESAGKRRVSRTRRGNTTLREVLVECAHGAAHTSDCQFEGFSKALTVRRGRKRAIVATASKMLRVIYAVLKSGKPYQDPHTDYEAKMVLRNAPRWITMLQKHALNPSTGLPLPKPAA